VGLVTSLFDKKTLFLMQETLLVVLNLLKFNYDFTNFAIEDKEFEISSSC